MDVIDIPIETLLSSSGVERWTSLGDLSWFAIDVCHNHPARLVHQTLTSNFLRSIFAWLACQGPAMNASDYLKELTFYHRYIYNNSIHFDSINWIIQ